MEAAARGDTTDPLELPQPINGGDAHRTYRLAAAATGEYCRYFQQKNIPPLQAVAVTINRVRAIYERELAVSFIIVAKSGELMFPDPATDPYTNDNANALLEENQAKMDEVVRDANYDFGHVFSTAGGGLAAPASVCDSGR